MSNSSLVDYVKISPNKTSPRTNKIKKLTIHHMAGNLSVETCANVFSGTTRVSANYGIGTDGRVGMYVEEKDRAWTSYSTENDDQAITIEVANDEIGGNWHVSDKALAKLIDLCVDVCKRNGIEKINYTGDKTGNLTMHKWFYATACPGPYLESKFPWIAEEINKRLGVVEQKPVVTTKFNIGDEVKLVSGAKYTSGASIPSWVFNQKLYVREYNGSNVVISTLKTGAVTGVVAEKYLVGFNQTVVNNAPAAEFEVGDVIKLVSGAKYTSGASIPNWVINSTLYARELQGDNVVFSTLKTGAVTGVVNKKYIVGNKEEDKKEEFKPYVVKVTVDVLNIRAGAGTNYALKGTITDHGAYTIVEEKNGYGKLRSGAGWIYLDYTERV